MGEQSGARLGGDDYQHLYSWYEILPLLDEASPYAFAYVEHPEAGAADDVTLHPRVGSGVPTRFIQVKWHVDYREHYTFEKLVELTSGTKSLLQKLFDSWRVLRAAGAIEVWLVSNWSPAPHPNLGAYLSDRAPNLTEDFFSRKKPAQVAKARDLWAKNLNAPEEEMAQFCRDLRFHLGYAPVHRLMEQLDDRMARYGLRLGDNARAVVLDEVRQRIQRGGDAKRITRGDIVEIIERRGLRADLPESPKARLWVHGWARQGYDLPPTVELDWTTYFDREERRVATPEEWRSELLPGLRAAREQLGALAEGKYVDFRGKVSLTAALAVGASLPQVAGFSFRAEQPIGGETYLWRSDTPPNDSRFVVVHEDGQPGDDLALGLSITGRGLPDMKRFASMAGISVLVYAEPATGTGPTAVADASDATALANSAKELIRNMREKYGARCVHLLLYGPVSFALFLGQVLNAVGTVVTYERTIEGDYQESVTLRTG